ncbi:MAG: hypothetical protein JW996_02605 [Candidatus Cloacimonetes bacterium]|nr:hypothetical protein [Candidatus Cloacimonadota bacterium]
MNEKDHNLSIPFLIIYPTAIIFSLLNIMNTDFRCSFIQFIASFIILIPFPAIINRWLQNVLRFLPLFSSILFLIIIMNLSLPDHGKIILIIIHTLILSVLLLFLLAEFISQQNSAVQVNKNFFTAFFYYFSATISFLSLFLEEFKNASSSKEKLVNTLKNSFNESMIYLRNDKSKNTLIPYLTHKQQKIMFSYSYALLFWILNFAIFLWSLSI